MEWVTYLLAFAGIVVGIVLGFIASGLWMIAVPRWRRRHHQR